MSQYQIKQPACVDFYWGEYPVAWQPVLRAIFKASGRDYDGVIRQDRKVVEYTDQCKQIGQRYGLYHFLLPGKIQQQVDMFLSVIDKVGEGNMPAIVDVEVYPSRYNINNETWKSQVKEFLDTLELYLFHKPMIYTSRNYWSCLIVNGETPSWSSNYPLWVAQYPDPVDIDLWNQWNEPTWLPYGWDRWGIWQYMDWGRSEGFFANDYSVVSDWFKEYLDADWNNMDVSVPFPSDVFIDDRNYRKVG